MHMRWPQVGGTQIGRYYISERGLLTENKASPQGWTNGHIAPFMPGETFTTYDLHARGVYCHTITPEGWLDLGRPAGSTCKIIPAIGGSGFETGALVACPGSPKRSVFVTDDIKDGLLIFKIEADGASTSEVYRYDQDRGVLINSR
jgi:hypothetical protein